MVLPEWFFHGSKELTPPWISRLPARSAVRRSISHLKGLWKRITTSVMTMFLAIHFSNGNFATQHHGDPSHLTSHLSPNRMSPGLIASPVVGRILMLFLVRSERVLYTKFRRVRTKKYCPSGGRLTLHSFVSKHLRKENLPAGRPPYFLIYKKFGNEKITTQLGDLESHILSEAKLLFDQIKKTSRDF